MQSTNKRLIDGWSSRFVGALNSGLDGIGKLASLASRSHSSESRLNSASVVSGRVHWLQAVRSRAATMIGLRIGFFDSRSGGIILKNALPPRYNHATTTSAFIALSGQREQLDQLEQRPKEQIKTGSWLNSPSQLKF